MPPIVVVVTHQGPCTVSEELFQSIQARRRRDRTFNAQILFVLEVLQPEEFSVHTEDMPLVETMAAFEEAFLLDDPPPRRRNLLL